MFNTIKEAIEFVQNRPRGEIKFDDFKNICKSLGNPQNGFKYIHVTGTNGKGSTITFLRDLLMEHGFTVGTLQSPHFITHLDRIRVNGENIDEQFFLDSVNRDCEFYLNNNIGMFEIDYLIALDYFKKKNVDFVLVEVGIGGRLDSTNVVDDTSLSIITSIGLDHTDLLGDTYEEICKEKCGIIKNNCDVIIPKLSNSLINIVKDKADETNSKLHIVNNIKIKDKLFIFNNEEYSLNTEAKYQVSNACLALESLNVLSEKYEFSIDKYKVNNALNHFVWRGRYDIVSKNPKIILDGAHNNEGIIKLMESFDNEKGKKLIVFSALKRKNFREMNNLLKYHADKYIVTTFNYPGSIEKCDIEDGIEFVEEYKTFIDINKANYDVILICGSLYFISDVVNKFSF